LFSLDAQVCENFDDMNLKEELLRGIYAYGFEKPSAIQQRAIVPCIKVPTYLPTGFTITVPYLYDWWRGSGKLMKIWIRINY